jgi:hypothetical protein
MKSAIFLIAFTLVVFIGGWAIMANANNTRQASLPTATTFVTVAYEMLPDDTFVRVIQHQETGACYAIAHRWQGVAITETAKEVCR